MFWPRFRRECLDTHYKGLRSCLRNETCERIVLGKGAKVLIREKCAGYLSPTSRKKKMKNRRMKRTMREKMESNEEKGESQRIKTTTS